MGRIRKIGSAHCNYSQILYQFLTFTQNLKRSRILSSNSFPFYIFLIQLNVLHAIMSDEHSSFFYDTIVFHQNMLVGSYDDRCYTDILLPIFSSRRRVLALYLRNHRGIMNSMIRSGLLCSVHTKILQRLICC